MENDPPSKTTATEKECYAATGRVLDDIAMHLNFKEHPDAWFNVLRTLATTFHATATHPEGQGRCRIVVMDRKTKMHDPVREKMIARRVYDLHTQGKTYTQAYKQVAEEIGLKDTSQVKKAYRKYRQKGERELTWQRRLKQAIVAAPKK